MRHARQDLRRLSGLVTSFLDAWDLHLYVVTTLGNARSSLRSPLLLSLSEINGPRQASGVDRNLDVSLRRRNRHPVLAPGLTLWGAKSPSAASLLTIANRRPLLQRDWAEGWVLHFLVWAILTALQPKALLVAENLCLRQQLLVLHRRRPQARLCHPSHSPKATPGSS
jgi:hypothetical protein